MLCVSCFRCSSVELALGVLEVERVEKVAALVALVTSGVGVCAKRTFTLDETVGQEALVLFAIRLLGCLFSEVAVLVQLGEDVLGNLGLLCSGRPAEVVELNLEPVVDLLVDLVVLVAQLFGVTPSSIAFVSVAVPYSSVPQT